MSPPPPATAGPGPGPGPGTELSKIFTALGVAGKCGGGCPEWIAKMNAWGPDGCEAHREEILAHLNNAYASLEPSWSEKATIGVNALAMGIVINPLDPAATLLDEAIRRAKSLA